MNMILDSHTGKIMKLTGWTAWEISRVMRTTSLGIVELHNAVQSGSQPTNDALEWFHSLEPHEQQAQIELRYQEFCSNI